MSEQCNNLLFNDLLSLLSNNNIIIEIIKSTNGDERFRIIEKVLENPEKLDLELIFMNSFQYLVNQIELVELFYKAGYKLDMNHMHMGQENVIFEHIIHANLEFFLFFMGDDIPHLFRCNWPRIQTYDDVNIIYYLLDNGSYLDFNFLKEERTNDEIKIMIGKAKRVSGDALYYLSIQNRLQEIYDINFILNLLKLGANVNSFVYDWDLLSELLIFVNDIEELDQIVRLFNVTESLNNYISGTFKIIDLERESSRDISNGTAARKYLDTYDMKCHFSDLKNNEVFVRKPKRDYWSYDQDPIIPRHLSVTGKNNRVRHLTYDLSIDSVRYLITRGATVNNYDIINNVCKIGDVAVADLLIDHGAPIDFEIVQIERYITSVRSVLNTALFKKHYDLARLLIDRGSNPTYTLMYIAGDQRWERIRGAEQMKFLIDHDGDPDYILYRLKRLFTRDPTILYLLDIGNFSDTIKALLLEYRNE